MVPMFYRRDLTGMPREWIARVKHALVSLAWNYNAARMVVDYAQLCYLPAVGAATSAVPDESDLDLPTVIQWLGRGGS